MAQSLINIDALGENPDRRDIITQASAMVNGYPSGQLKQLCLLPNAQKGVGFRPLQGFALELAPDAEFRPSDYNTQALFKGAVVLPLIPSTLKVKCSVNKMSKCYSAISAEDVLGMFEASRAESLSDINQNSDHLSLSPLSGDGEPSSVCLLNEPKSGQFYVLVVGHNLPDSSAIGGDISSFLDKTLDKPLTVSEAFFPGNDVGTTMSRYYNSQKAYRALVAHKFRYRMLKRLYPEIDVDAYYTCDAGKIVADMEAIHMVTNTADRVANSFVFYSNATRATLVSGSLISAGPFRQALWVNVPRGRGKDGKLLEGGSSQAVRDAKKLEAIPFSVPMSSDYMGAIQSIVEHRAGTSSSTKGRFVEVVTSEGLTHLRSSISKHHSQANFGPMSVAMCDDDGVGGVGDLIWRHQAMQPLSVPCRTYHNHHHKDCSHHQCELHEKPKAAWETIAKDPVVTMETFSPHEMTEYTRGFESEATRRSIESLGVSLGAEQNNNIFMTPLFCATGALLPHASFAAMVITKEIEALKLY